MTRLSQMFRPALISLVALFAGTSAQAQLVETVKDYTMTIGEPVGDCSSLQTPGDLCGNDLNIIYVGEAVSGSRLFAMSSPLAPMTWNDGSSSNVTLLNVSHPVTGAVNTAVIAASDANSWIGGGQTHRAAAACEALDYDGYQDWYLPSLQEAVTLHLGRAHFASSPRQVWTSTERDAAYAHSYDVGTGAVTAQDPKWANRNVLCVRAEAGSGSSSGSVYAGESPSGGALYAMSLRLAPVTWNDGSSSNVTLLNREDPITGASNSSAISNADANSWIGGTQRHLAALTCEGLVYAGHSDWYLPSLQEAAVLYRNRASLPISSGQIWTSTENDASYAYSYNVGTGAVTSQDPKWAVREVQCVRRNVTPIETPEPCEGVTALGGTCGGGDLVYAGESPSGGVLYTTNFPFASVTWNDGSSSNVTLTNQNNPVIGAANTSALSVADANSWIGGAQRHVAAATCEGLNYGGYQDWHLPSLQEATVLSANRASLPISSGQIWTSTEKDSAYAHSFNIGTGEVTSQDPKWAVRGVICVRSGPGVSDGSGAVYAGESPSGGTLYTTSIRLAPVSWNDGSSSNVTLTGRSDPVDGAVNSLSLASADANSWIGGTQRHLAALTCEGLVYAGHSDWYLPSLQEAATLHRNRASLPVSSGQVWTSTEKDSVYAHSYDLGTGAVTTQDPKWAVRGVQCVRRDPSVAVTGAPCSKDTPIGSACGTSGDLVRAGSVASGHPLFTTSFLMTPVSWNDGSSSNVTLTGRSDPTNGSANTAVIASADSNSWIGGVQRHLAAAACANLNYAGRTDWYLPSVEEAAILHLNRASLPVRSGQVWTSTETDAAYARSVDLATGTVTVQDPKWAVRSVQCVFAQTEYAVALLSDLELTTGQIGAPWSADLSTGLLINGGDPANRPAPADFTWQVISGFLPAGLTLDPASGLLSGSPQASGSTDFIVRASHDPSGLFAEATVRVATNAAGGVVRLFTGDVPPGYSVSADRLTMTSLGLSTDYQRWMKADIRIPKTNQTYYWEVALSGGSSAWNGYVGIVSKGGDALYSSTGNPVNGDSIAWRGNGDVWGDGTETTVPAGVGSQRVVGGASWAYGNGDVLMLAFNPMSGSFWIGKNGVWRNTPGSSPTFDVNGANEFASEYAVPSLQARSGAGESLTLRSSLAQFSYPVPAGTRPLADLIDMVPDPMVFAARSEVDPDLLVTSDPVTIVGINTPTPIFVSDGAEYRVNGGGWTAAPGEVTVGQIVEVRLTSGAFGETVTGQLNTGGLLTSFTVTTRDALLAAAPFSFEPAPNRTLGELVISNAITLVGPDVPDTVTITGPGAEYSLNGAEYTSASGFARNGDVIRLRMPAPAIYSASAEAVLSVGQVSASWTVSTSASCTEVSIPGQLCDDGQIIYVGDSVSGGALYTTTFTLPAVTWNDGSANYTTTNRRDPIYGDLNTVGLLTADANASASGVQSHLAAAACGALVSSGYDDWYLPSVQEAVTLHRNRAVLPVAPGQIWTSTETSYRFAHSYNVGTGAVSSSDYKYTARAVQCVRRGSAPLEPAGIVYVGDSVSGGALYTTSFTLAPVFWNDGDANYITTNRDDPVNGSANTAGLATADANSSVGGTQRHLAAASCEGLNYGGYQDWYLPSVQEATDLHRNQARLPIAPGQIWTSTETSYRFAHSYNVGTGAVSSSDYKYTARAVQCVRKDPAPLEPAGIVYVGDSVSGGALYTTPFTLAPVFWNDGDANYITTNRDDPVNGSANTAGLATADANSSVGGTQRHLAAASCAALDYGGYQDWYLPSVQEATDLHRNRARLPVAPGQIWTSTETSYRFAHSYNVGTGAVTTSEYKYTARAVQCVRKDPVPLETAQLILLGEAPSGGTLYTTPFPLAPVFWNDGDANYVTTNRDDPVNGSGNTAGLATTDSNTSVGGTQRHLAAATCQGLNYGGYQDWYLPSVQEAVILHLNRTALPVAPGQIWTSTEASYRFAHSYNVGTGAVTTSEYKYTARTVQCVRRAPESPQALQSCESVTEIGDVCGSGDLVYAGIAPNGDRLFTTSFAWAPVFWNDGDANYVTTGLTSSTAGAANTASLASRDANASVSGVQRHLAASTCDALTYGGYSDWYLPATQEALVLSQNRALLPVKSGLIWTSTETDYRYASSMDVSNGALTSTTFKYTPRSIQCVRSVPVPVDPTVVLTDGFETFSGWSVIGSGSLTAATDQARSGSGSVLKTTADDPNGGYKLLGSPVSRNYEIEAWVRSSEPRVGGGADRISILDANGNGYGFNIGSASHALDVRTGYASTIVSGVTWSRPSNTWYRVVFRSFPDNTFRTTIYDATGVELSTHAYAADATHTGPFDRVAILGGREFHVDDVKVTNFDRVTPFWNPAP